MSSIWIVKWCNYKKNYEKDRDGVKICMSSLKYHKYDSYIYI